MKIDNNKQITAVQTLANFLNKHCNPSVCDIDYADFKLAIAEALDIERQHIENAWNDGALDWDTEMEGNDYYNETFGDTK